MRLFKRESNPKAALEDMLEGYTLPSFPQVVIEVLSLLRDPGCGMPEISKEVNRDPALIMAVFHMVNSAAFGLRSRVDDILQAVTLLGRSRLESIVLMQAVQDAQPSINASWFDSKGFWQTSAKRATLARHLANKLHPVTATHAFTAGMLQDMAIPLLTATLTKKYSKVAKAIARNEVSLIEVEQDLLNCDHQMVGELMAKEWNLPDYLIRSISGHHYVSKVDPAVGLVSLIRNEDVESSVKDLVIRCGEDFKIQTSETELMIATAFEEADTITFG